MRKHTGNDVIELEEILAIHGIYVSTARLSSVSDEVVLRWTEENPEQYNMVMAILMLHGYIINPDHTNLTKETGDYSAMFISNPRVINDNSNI